MMTTHRQGKIARLPHFIRAQLNQRLADNEPATDLVRWLNAQPEVKEVLTRQFAGRRITQQNISAWKQGGYLDWERFEESRRQARTFLEEADELIGDLFDPEEVAGDNGSFLDRMGDRMALSLMQLFRETELRESGPDRTRDLLHIAREMARLRRGDHQRQRTALAQKRRFEEKLQAAEQEEKDRINAAIMERELLRDQVYALHMEYLLGLARNDLPSDRHEKISTFFWQNDERIRLYGFPALPQGKELLDAIERTRKRLSEGIVPKENEGGESDDDKGEVETAEEPDQTKATEDSEQIEDSAEPDEAGQEATHEAPETTVKADNATETEPTPTEKIQPSPAFTNPHQAAPFSPAESP